MRKNYEIHENQSSMNECPNCGKNSLTQINEGRFHCIWCGFRRDVTDSEHSYFGGQFAGFLLFTIVIFFVVGIFNDTNQSAPNEEARIEFSEHA